MRWPRLAPAATMRAGEGVAPPTEVAMKMSIARRLGAFALLFPLLLPLTLHAQSLPKPKEFYFDGDGSRSEEHTSELQSLMRISYAVFCLKKKKHTSQ